MKYIKIGLFIGIGLALFLSGCGRTAQPNFHNGRYYMAGDDNCVRSNMRNAYTINCYNSSGQYTGYRHAMNNQQISMYQHNQQMRAYQSAQTDRFVQDTLNRSRANTQRIDAQVNSMNTPTYDKAIIGSMPGGKGYWVKYK